MNYIEFDREDDGRWIAEIIELPGVMAYGVSQQEAELKVQAIAAELAQ
jgi:predicted RNase H-like HicB family nuclease